MTDLRTAAQQALDYWGQVSWGDAVMVDKMDALKAALAEPVQEPVAWKDKIYETLYHQNFGNSIPLYTAPPQRKPLTEEEIDSIWDSEKAFADIYAIVRAIERAHGIT